MEKKENTTPATVRFKSQGRFKGTKDVKPFRGGGWKEWLEFQVELKRLYTFLRLDNTHESMRDLGEVISQLLSGRDLEEFQSRYEQARAGRPPTRGDINTAMRGLEKRYCPLGTRDELHKEIRSLRKTRALSVEEYDQRFHALLELEPWVQIDDGAAMTVTDQCRYYSEGMPRSWQMQVVPQRSRWDDMDKLKARYVQCERVENSGSRLSEPNARSKHSKRGQEETREPKSKPKAPFNGNKRRKVETGEGCNFCRTRGNVWNNHGNEECFRNPNSPKYRPRTNNTGGRKMGANLQASAAAVSNDGHGEDPMNYWTKSEEGESTGAAAKPEVETSVGVPTLRMKVQMKHPLNKQTYTVLLDSGTTTSMVAKEVVSWYKPTGAGMKFRNVNNESYETKGSISLPFVLPEFSTQRECVQECEIADKLVYPIILGNDFLQRQGMVLDYQRREIRWDDLTAKMNTKPEPPVRVAFAVQDNDDRTLKVLDVTGKEIDLEKLVPKDHLNPDQQNRLREVLKSYRIVNVQVIGKLNRKPYVLPVKPGSKPYAARPYPIPMIHRDAVFREVERLIKLGVLEPDKDSPWGAPCFVIAKKDGTVRFLTDFRGLNRNLDRRYYPLNDAQTLLRELPEPGFISALDLTMGYYSRVLAEESRPYTAIVLPWGKFRYCRLPMGISTAPDEFQAVMQQLLGDLPFVRVYLDDVLVISKSFDEHLEHLNEVLRRLQDAGLVINTQKSKFCMTEVEYLGFHLSTTGKKPLQKKISAILNLERPRNIRDLRRFIGMINYYKDMWRSRSQTLAPLTALTSIKRPFQWTEVEQKAFDAAKQMISEDVLLAYPNFNEPFELYTDASERQLGGVVMQGGRPLAFWSRKCTDSQRRYTMNKKELLSVLEMLREFRSILWGRPIKIFTDHKNSIQAVFNNPQMLRWRLEIEEFGPEMNYIRGHDNVVADALSRLPSQTEMVAASLVPAQEGNSQPWPLSLVEIAEAQQHGGLHEGPEVARRAIGSTKVLVSKANGRIVIPPELVNKVLNTYHEWLVHPGERVMLESLKAAVMWPGMTSAVQAWVRNCEVCARSKGRGSKYGKLPTKTVEVRPWAEIAVDTLGPIGSRQWRALTIIDTSTRLVEIVAMQDGTSAEAARIVDQMWFNRYPRPERCIYDQGPEFSTEFQELLASYGVEYAGNTAKNPQANGVVERVHRSINDKLRTETIASEEDWENCLSSVMFALRAQHHTMTALSPCQAAFGRDMLFDCPKVVDWNEQQRRKETQVARAADKENAQRKEHEFRPEDLVMIARGNQRAPKLQQPFEGPFRVFSVRNDGVLVIDKGKYTETIHTRRVQPFQATNMGEDVVPSHNSSANSGC